MFHEECDDGDGSQDGPKTKVLGKQFALNEGKSFSRNDPEHGNS